MAESHEQFAARVERATGVAFGQISEGDEGDLLGGTIFCRRGPLYVVAVGYPDSDDENGQPCWAPLPENFRRVEVAR